MTDRKIVPLTDSKKIEATAAHWIMRSDDGDLSAADQIEFDAWLAKSEHHRAAFKRLQGVWGQLDALNELNDYAASMNSTETAASRATVLSYFRFPQKPLEWCVAASLIVVVIAGLFQTGVFNSAEFSASYETAVGEQQTIDLPDGSTVILNTNSQVEVDYSRFTRNIFLAKGEAYFDVAKNSSAPFVVRTGRGSITAVGTAFSVRLQEAKINVVVTEGRVALSPIVEIDNALVADVISAPVLMEVTAGQSVAFAERIESLEPIEPAAIERELDWRDGVINFKGESLEQVISDISPYTSLVINIDGEELRQQPIGGYFKVGEIEALFDALKIMANIEVERTDNEHVRLYLN